MKIRPDIASELSFDIGVDKCKFEEWSEIERLGFFAWLTSKLRIYVIATLSRLHVNKENVIKTLLSYHSFI